MKVRTLEERSSHTSTVACGNFVPRARADTLHEKINSGTRKVYSFRNLRSSIMVAEVSLSPMEQEKILDEALAIVKSEAFNMKRHLVRLS